MQSYVPKPDEIRREWVVMDASDQVLGRLATEVARLLRGKHKPEYTPFLDTGDFVVVVNARGIRLTGRKEQDKVYYRHATGRPGSLKKETAAEALAQLVPLRPGAQTVDVEWHQSTSSVVLSKAPQVTIGEQAVNADVMFNMPRNRWLLLTGGPCLGPAVLFWSYLFVIILAGVGLGRLSWTPLSTRHWLLLGLGLDLRILPGTLGCCS